MAGWDDLKALLGKHGKVSLRGAYAGLILGRGGGGYLAYELGNDLYSIGGSLGGEELALAGITGAGYLAGAYTVSKAVTEIDERLSDDVSYTRPFLIPIRKLEAIGGEEEEEEDFEVLEGLE